jgi:hypothetical protein
MILCVMNLVRIRKKTVAAYFNITESINLNWGKKIMANLTQYATYPHCYRAQVNDLKQRTELGSPEFEVRILSTQSKGSGTPSRHWLIHWLRNHALWTQPVNKPFKPQTNTLDLYSGCTTKINFELSKWLIFKLCNDFVSSEEFA